MKELNLKKITKVVNEHLELIDILEDYLKNTKHNTVETVKLNHQINALKRNVNLIKTMLDDYSETHSFNYNALNVMETEYRVIKKKFVNNYKYQKNDVYKLLLKSLNKDENER